MANEMNDKGMDGAATERQDRAASVTEHLQAAKAELLSGSTQSPAESSSVSLKPLYAGIGVIALVAVLWMVFGGSRTHEVHEPAVPVVVAPEADATGHDTVAEPSAALVEARERARLARDRIRAAEEGARLARERRLALEAEQASQRAREAEQARRESEALAAELAAAKEASQRQALEARQAKARREAEERAARAEQERQAALAAQQVEEEQASRQVDEVREGLGGDMTWGVDL
jgi:colicin import membrane protein